MKNERLDCKDFALEELREALKFYTERANNGKATIISDMQSHIRTSRNRAETLLSAASWAYKVQQKEKAQMEAKRKRAC